MIIEITSYGGLIRHFRKRAGWSVQEAAAILNVSRVGLWRWEKDLNAPRAYTRDLIYQAYGMSDEEIQECEDSLV